MILGLALASVVGFSLGLLGGGGSILAVPILVYVLGYDAKPAIAMSLAVVGVTSLLGAARHWSAGNVDGRTALVFGAVAMVASYLGARAAGLLSGAVQLEIFGTVMLVASIFMFRERDEQKVPDSGEAGTFSFVLIATQAAFVGLLTGIVGVGGGFLIVPALVLLAGVPMKRAVGTSLLVIAMNSASGFVGYLDQVTLPWGFLAGFTGMALVGVVVGSSLVNRVPQRALRRIFAGFLVIMAVFILFENRDSFRGRDSARPPADRARLTDGTETPMPAVSIEG